MSNLVEVYAPKSETLGPENPPAKESPLQELLQRVSKLESQMLASDLWANRWAKEQVQLGLIIRDLQNNILSKQEIDTFRAFITEFQKAMGEEK